MDGIPVRPHACRVRTFAAALLLVAASAAPAAAQPPPSDTSIDANRLWLPVGPTHFTTLRGSEVPPHLRVHGATFGVYQHRTVVLRQEGRGEFDAVEAQVDAHVILAVGLWDRLEIGAAVPLRLVQYGVGIAPLLDEEPDGRVDVIMLGDMRFAADLSVLRRPADGDGLGLLVSAALAAPTGDDGLFTSGDTWVVAPLVSADYRLGRLLFAAEAGARIRPETRALGAARFGSTLVGRGGVAWFPVDDPVSLSLEGGAELELAGQPGESSESQHVYDLAAGVRWSPVDPGDYTIRGAFALGAGGFGAPVFRFVLGLEYGARAEPLGTSAPAR